jgi:signal transduction histidine kinase
MLFHIRADNRSMPSRVGRKETRFIASLFEVPRHVGQASLAEFLEIIVHRCSDWFGASSVSLFLRQADESVMKLAATGGEAVAIPKQATIQIGRGIAGIAAQDGAPVLINDLGAQARFRSLLGQTHRPLVSSMVVPLTIARGTIGVLNLSRTLGCERFSEADLKLARSVASHLALAVENARLVASIQSEREKFRGIFDGLGLAAFLLSTEGEVVESNPAANRFDFLSMAPVQKLIKRGSKRRDLEFDDPASGRSWMAVLNPIPGGATLILEETTERERQRREMDRLNRLAEFGQMTAAIAHEIRNPLTGIRSAAQMIREMPEASDEFAGIIEHEAMKLNDLCSQFLGFAKPLELRMQRMDLREVIQRTQKLMLPQFQAKQVHLDVEISGHLPIIEGDPLRWEQVLQNLMLNALQASEQGGKVVVGASMSGIWVEDSGSGMTDEHIQKLFSPFFTTKPQGTGLGLSTVKKILDAHQASIHVSSAPGKGARFDISLPVRRAA